MTVTDSILDDIILREGVTYTNRPNDRGGPTKFGITLKTLSEWRNKACMPEDVEALEEPEARLIYQSIYIAPFTEWSGHEFLFRLVVDSAVQHGVSRVKGWLAAIIPTTPDPEVIRRKFFQRRMVFYGEIVHADISQASNIHGWLVRLSNFVR